jgi:hypothetical protein
MDTCRKNRRILGTRFTRSTGGRPCTPSYPTVYLFFLDATHRFSTVLHRASQAVALFADQIPLEPQQTMPKSCLLRRLFLELYLSPQRRSNVRQPSTPLYLSSSQKNECLQAWKTCQKTLRELEISANIGQTSQNTHHLALTEDVAWRANGARCMLNNVQAFRNCIRLHKKRRHKGVGMVAV